MEKKQLQINIFDYTDYRKYLADFYSGQKRRIAAFSYRYFAKKAGINSIGLYKDVVEGRQNLGKALIYKFSSAIGFGKKESEYFENMVNFNEAKTVEERKMFFERMMSCRTLKTKIIDASKYEYYRKWYYSAIRAILSYSKYTDSETDCAIIAKKLIPQIRADQVKKSIDVLAKLGFIKKNEEGFLVLEHTAVSTGIVNPDKNVSALNVVNHQKEMMALAMDAFNRFSYDKLSMSTVSLSISEQTLLEIKDELSALRNKISGMAEKDANADRVVQLNIQLFPLTDKKSGISK